jgi:putative endonuclease
MRPARRRAGPGAQSGARAERFAASFLCRSLGYRIVARNWRNPGDRREEIDLVCRDGEAVVFVEVRARAAHARVQGFDTINRRKRRALRSAIRAYLARLRPPAASFRVDVAEISMENGNPAEVRHFRNVPLFSKPRH